MNRTKSRVDGPGKDAQNQSASNGHAMSDEAAGANALPSNPINAALALRDSLREVLGRTNDLIQVLRRHKKQSRLVESTIQSLKELQAAG